MIYKARDDLKWADQKKVVDLINQKKKDILGDAPKGDGKKKKPAKPVEEKKEEKKVEQEEEKK